MRSEFRKTKVAAIIAAIPGDPATGAADGFRSPPGQTAADLGCAAAEHIFEQTGIARAAIGVLVFASKTPDYRSPATACVLQGRLGLSTDCAVFDLNSGSVGLLHGLQVVAAMMEASNQEAGFLIAGDTTTRQFKDGDPVAEGYGDGAVAILLLRAETGSVTSLVVECGSDGGSVSQFLFADGAFRYPASMRDFDSAHGLKAISSGHLVVDSLAFATVARNVFAGFVPRFVESVAGSLDHFDLIAMQQLGCDVVEGLRSIWGLPAEKIPVHTSVPDLCAASIPALLAEYWPTLSVSRSRRVLACSFGEGFSWGCAELFLDAATFVQTIYSKEVFADGAVSRNF
jgi:3-oxoacyl-[acyl-carrier-protein] synthase III